jgi:8-oxo-dGTP pyrophosphatase MutT (NUDIX family)
MTLQDRLATRLARYSGGIALADGDDQWRIGRASVEEMAASVLVAFVDRPHPTLLLTRRPDHMRNHSGQVAFPGGRADEADADTIATALREAHEEVALAEQQVHVIGAVPTYLTNTGYRITPVLAVIAPDLPLVPQPSEVARIFEVRCDHLFDPAMQRQQTVEWQGAPRTYWEVLADGERVWGVTAGIIRNIGDLLGLHDDPRCLNRDFPA